MSVWQQPCFIPGVSGGKPAALSEVLAVAGHAHAAAAFALGLAGRALQERGGHEKGAIVWISSDADLAEMGEFSGYGLVALGLDPACLILARLRTVRDTLRATLEAARCSDVDAVVLEINEPVDLTASRRLKLAAGKSGVAVIIVRHGDVATPNAAQIRWRVGAAVSSPRPEHASHRPRFDVTLLKHPAGLPEHRRLLEWDRERVQFCEALPRSLAAISAG